MLTPYCLQAIVTKNAHSMKSGVVANVNLFAGAGLRRMPNLNVFPASETFEIHFGTGAFSCPWSTLTGNPRAANFRCIPTCRAIRKFRLNRGAPFLCGRIHSGNSFPQYGQGIIFGGS